MPNRADALALIEREFRVAVPPASSILVHRAALISFDEFGISFEISKFHQISSEPVALYSLGAFGPWITQRVLNV